MCDVSILGVLLQPHLKTAIKMRNRFLQPDIRLSILYIFSLQLTQGNIPKIFFNNDSV